MPGKVEDASFLEWFEKYHPDFFESKRPENTQDRLIVYKQEQIAAVFYICVHGQTVIHKNDALFPSGLIVELKIQSGFEDVFFVNSSRIELSNMVKALT